MGFQTILIVVVIAAAVLIAIGCFLRRRKDSADDTLATSAAPLRQSGWAERIRASLGRGLGDDTWDQLEETLLAGDVGVGVSSSVVASLRRSNPETPEDAQAELIKLIRAQMFAGDRSLDFQAKPAVILMVGVNGAGKTTTIAKVANMLTQNEKTVLLGAADTFRAAAGEQLKTWGDRIGVPTVKGEEGADPASVAFDSVSSAKAKGVDIVMIDTAGRLHDKGNLMAELSKIHRVVAGEASVDEILLVLDATAGQNGLSQVREFAQTVPLSGIVLSKFDATAKGGIVVAVESEFGVPVKFVGVGEKVKDIEVFDPDAFLARLVERAEQR